MTPLSKRSVTCPLLWRDELQNDCSIGERSLVKRSRQSTQAITTQIRLGKPPAAGGTHARLVSELACRG
jgi:hypothetical protein